MIRVFLVYALSGFVALGYQVVWFRLFPDWFGSTSLSFALVACNFIGGLGAGSLASGPITKWIARVSGITDALRLYGMIELLVAVAAVLTLLAGHLPADLWGDFPYHLDDGIWVQNPGYRFGQLAVAVSCVFAPCFLMGTTFPLLSQRVSRLTRRIAVPGSAIWLEYVRCLRGRARVPVPATAVHRS